MVFIPPLPNAQYDQYAERKVKRKQPPFRLAQAVRTRPIKDDEENQFQSSERKKKSLSMKKSSVHKIKQNMENDSMYREITGKGKNIDMEA